jgi:hypothetical protein
MKSAARILSIAVLAGLPMFYMACDNGGDNEKPIIDQQIEKLNGNWSTTVATLDGVAPPIDQDGFKIELTGIEGDPTMSFQTTRPDGLSAWPSSGSLEIDANNPEGKMVRDDGVTVTYNVSGNTLVMDFTFSGDPYPSGRVQNVQGNWHYEFNKP